MFNLHFGISMLSSNLKLIQPEMLMIPSLSQNPKRLLSMISNISIKLKKYTKLEVLEVRDITVNGKKNKLKKTFFEHTQPLSLPGY